MIDLVCTKRNLDHFTESFSRWTPRAKLKGASSAYVNGYLEGVRNVMYDFLSTCVDGDILTAYGETYYMDMVEEYVDELVTRIVNP